MCPDGLCSLMNHHPQVQPKRDEYTDRKRARSVARQHAEHKNVYPCTESEGLYHIGRLPDEVRHGHMTKDEFFAEHTT
jgi:hypothetical protein